MSVFAEIAQDTGPCRRLLFKLNHTAVNAAAKPSPLTSPTTLAKEISGRSALAQSATQVTADFAALPHCLGKS